MTYREMSAEVWRRLGRELDEQFEESIRMATLRTGSDGSTQIPDDVARPMIEKMVCVARAAERNPVAKAALILTAAIGSEQHARANAVKN